jgi:hypothetical protein
LKHFAFLLFFTAFTSTAQPLVEFNQERVQTDCKLMLSLGSWSVVNIMGSGIAWGTTKDEQSKYFHQMNVTWNIVNLGLAIPGYIKARKSEVHLGFKESLIEQQRTEKAFLFNTALDLSYMSAGLLLRSEAKSNLEKEAQFRGFGNSLLLQGGFLFLFDLTAYVIHHQHQKRALYPIFDRLVPSSSGLGFGWRLGPPNSKQGLSTLFFNEQHYEASLH